jgi:hypothetical protein
LRVVKDRPAASLRGVVEVRVKGSSSSSPSSSSSSTWRVKWLRVELEKIETVPQVAGHGGKKFSDYVELIGEKPEELIGSAGRRTSTDVVEVGLGRKQTSTGGKFRPRSTMGRGDDDEGWEMLKDGESSNGVRETFREEPRG